MTERPYEETVRPYEEQPFEFDQGELFALGAAAGAVITAAIASYLERRRRPKTVWERAQVQGVEALHALSGTTQASLQQARHAAATASERFQDRGDTRSKWWRPARKSTRRRSRRAKRSLGLKGLAATGLGVATAANALDKVLGFATSTTGRRFGRRRHGVGDTLRDVVHSAQEYGETLAHQAEDYASVAQKSLRDAHLSERARHYGDTLAHRAEDYASAAQRSLRDVHLGERARHYGEALAGYTTGATIATRQAAQESATKLTEGASHLAGATSKQAQEVRKGVRKSAKRTRRRVNWGLRAFIIGLAVGLLAAPQSGQRTRELLTSFVQDLLDVFAPNQ